MLPAWQFLPVPQCAHPAWLVSNMQARMSFFCFAGFLLLRLSKQPYLTVCQGGLEGSSRQSPRGGAAGEREPPGRISSKSQLRKTSSAVRVVCLSGKAAKAKAKRALTVASKEAKARSCVGSLSEEGRENQTPPEFGDQPKWCKKSPCSVQKVAKRHRFSFF